MTVVVDLNEEPELRCRGGTLRLRAPDLATLRSSSRAHHARLPDLIESNLVIAHCRDDAVLVVGEKSKTVWLARPHMLEVTAVAGLRRLDFGDRYDPGGMHRVAFHDLSEGGLLIEFELGVAMLGDDGSMVWQQAHDDLSARLKTIERGLVVLEGDEASHAFRLTDGTPTVQ